MGRIFCFILVVVLMVTAGCTTQEKCNRLFPCPQVNSSFDSSSHSVQDTTIKGGKVGVSYTQQELDSALKNAKLVPTGNIINGVPEMRKAIIIKDASGNTEMQIWKDDFNRLSFSCEAKDRLLKMYKDAFIKASTTVKTVTVTTNKIPWYCWCIIGAMGAIIILLIVKKFI